MKNKKFLIVLGIILLVIFVTIYIIHVMENNSKKRISENIIKNIQDNINSGSVYLTKEYIDNNISKVNEDVATEMVDLYEQYQDNNIERLYKDFKTALFKADGPYDIDILNNIENIENVELKNILTEIRSNGYKLKRVWGDIIVVKDYSQFEEYKEYVTEDKKIYLECQNLLESQVYSEQDNMNILKTLLEVENNINSIKDKEIKQETINKVYYELFLLVEVEEGNENTEITNFVNNNLNSITGKIFSDYISALKKDEYIYEENFYNFLEEIENNIILYFDI